MKMMKKAIFFLFAFVIPFTLISQEVSDKKLHQFCEKFAKAVESGNQKKCISFFDAAYRSEQLDGFLKGNTEQFLDEFLLGFAPLPPDVAGVDLPRFQDIQSMHFIDIQRDQYGSITAMYDITLKNGITVKMHAPIRVTGKNKFGFIGAMG